MIDTSAEEPTPKQGITEIILDSRITEPNSQPTPVEELEVFSVDPKDSTKILLIGKELNA